MILANFEMPTNIAEMVVFVSSPETSYATGANLNVGGDFTV